MSALTLVPDAANVRRRDDRAKAAIENSLKQFGPARSIVIDSNDVVRSGNGTLEGFVANGGTEVVVIDAEPGKLYAIKRADWNSVDATGYAIADNQIATKATWDYQALGQTLKALDATGFTIASLGFEAHELEPILAADWTPAKLDAMPGRDDGGSDDGGSHSVSFSAATWETVDDAIATCREAKSNLDLTEAQCLELICADYLLPR